MIQPCHNLIDRCDHSPTSQAGAVDQNDGQADFACGGQLGFGPRATGILGDDQADFMLDQQRLILIHIERPARQNNRAIGQRWAFGGIHQPQQVVVRFRRETRKVLFANRQEHPRRGFGQGDNRGLYAGDMLPFIAQLRRPCGALQRQQGHACEGTSLNCVAADLRGKGMGGINDRTDVFGLQIGLQPRHATKAAHPCRQRLRHGGVGASGIGKHRVAALQRAGQKAGFGGATKDKGARHG